ncbi:leucine-rich repeat-containing protein 55 [Protopterus annectens]|uniref:leucine-rich repeat-containing protein 55 n=1 Tax=Protopterus annectens TaxID=7888 RepID=UPI001CFA1864|nr:leucine-rich repeat-containing protein 55 [Protopterus annectens]
MCHLNFQEEIYIFHLKDTSPGMSHVAWPLISPVVEQIFDFPGLSPSTQNTMAVNSYRAVTQRPHICLQNSFHQILLAWGIKMTFGVPLLPFLFLLFSAPLAKGCPVLCSCWDRVVDCSGKHLFSVPLGLPLDIHNLTLAHNRLTSIPSGYLSCHMELRFLDLRNNSLSSLPDGLFLNLKKLVLLDLSHNNLTQVTAAMMQPAHSLVRINLSHNYHLTRIHSSTLRGMMQLQDLDLRFSGFSSLSYEVLEGLPSLISLQLSGNPWVCGCAMEPLLKWLRNSIKGCIIGSQEAECAAPPEVKGVPLMSLTEESFKACQFSLTLDDYLFIAFVGFVVSIASVATNFLLGITANCCHRWSKASEEEEI